MTENKRYYMACLDLSGRPCLVVGGGAIAHEKIDGLLACGAEVSVVALEPAKSVTTLAASGTVCCHVRSYEPGDLAGQWLVVAATDDETVNRRVFADAEAAGIFCNVADVPELCSFILPAVLRRDPIAVAISTGGASPVLAQRLRAEIEPIVRDDHAELAVALRALRPWAKRRYATYEERRAFFQALVDEVYP